jgi:hypothetical protein
MYGFVLSVVASVVSYVYVVSSGGIQFGSFQSFVNPLLGPLMTVTAVGAWWWLSLMEPLNQSQLITLRRAYLFFAIQYLLLAIGYDIIFTPIRYFGFWTTLALWIYFVGAIIVSIGLFLMFRSLATLEERARPDADVSELR